MDYGYKITSHGLELIAACVSSESALTLTRVAMGSGTIEDGTNLSDVHALAAYVTDGAISDRRREENELYLTVQYENKSRPEQEAFLLSEFMVYAEHPVTKAETDLLYATLGDYRQPVPAYRPSLPPSVFKFPIVLALSGDINVVVDAAAGMVTYDQLLESVSLAVADLSKELPKITAEDFTLETYGWANAPEAGDYYARVDSPGIPAECFFSIVFDDPESFNEARRCGVYACLIERGSEAGKSHILISAMCQPEKTLRGKCWIFSKGVNGAESGGGFVLPPATQTSLGGVKIGGGVGVEPDGTISVDGAGIISETAAGTEEVQEMLNGVFNEE